MIKQIYILFIFLSFLASAISAHAESIDNDPILHSSYGRELMLRGQYEKGLEQLRSAFLLFPLNELLKQNLAEGYAAFGHQSFKQKRYEEADDNFIKAMELFPEEATYSLLRGVCNYHLKKYDVARYELERARHQKEDSAEILYYLGLVQYETENRLQAVELWEQARKLSPERKEIAELLEKSRKEMAVESGMDRGRSSRFDLTYDPGIDSAFALTILDVLENVANQVGAELGHFPRSRVPVAIYKRGDFKTLTDSPDWSGGVYDGTIRLPFGALKEISPPMRGVLFHEYAHVVVFDITRGNCPLWLNEGIAEIFGRIQYNRPMPELGQSARKKTFVDFRKLESGFNNLSSSDAALAYQQSYAMVNYLVTTYGWHRITAILQGLGKGMTMDEAVTTELKDYSLSYDRLILEWKEYMERGIAGKE